MIYLFECWPPDLPSKPQHSNFFSLSGSEKRNKSPQADKKPWNSYMLLMFNNNTYTGFRTAQKHILNPSYAIQCDLTDEFHKTKH